MNRIDYEVHVKNEESQFIAYAINSGGVALSIFKPEMMSDRNARHFGFSCDADFINFADKIAILAEHVKRRN